MAFLCCCYSLRIIIIVDPVVVTGSWKYACPFRFGLGCRSCTRLEGQLVRSLFEPNDDCRWLEQGTERTKETGSQGPLLCAEMPCVVCYCNICKVDNTSDPRLSHNAYEVSQLGNLGKLSKWKMPEQDP